MLEVMPYHPNRLLRKMQSVGDPGVPPQQIAERMQSARGPRNRPRLFLTLYR